MMRRWLVAFTCFAFLAGFAFAQTTVSGYADVGICDVPGTNQVVVTGGHIVTEDGAPSGHTHTSVVAQGVITQYSVNASCSQDYGGTTSDTCSNPTEAVNGSAACSTQSGGLCTNSFRTKTLPLHNPSGGAINAGTAFSSCASTDCMGDPGCRPFSNICY